jgi:alpha-tubulin suppressor-like RCC1 family protein
VLAGGTVVCWGGNDHGQLGNGGTIDSSIPGSVVGITAFTPATAIAAGDRYTCALLADHTIDCWGANAVGALGNGTTSDSATPIPVTGVTNAGSITAGPSGNHTCARVGGPMKCWGWNHSGQLGNGTTTDSATPVAVTGISGTAISAGGLHTCARVGPGTVDCWGDNTSGQLGTGSFGGASVTPVAVTGLTSATAITAGGTASCALLANGTVNCWGSNLEGQLGDGTFSASNTRVPVSSLPTPAIAITGGELHTCALTEGGIYCWGFNFYGQLGNGTTSTSSTPVSVLGP